MREFVESLKRLFECGKIHKDAIDRQLTNNKITQQEFEYIIKDILTSD